MRDYDFEPEGDEKVFFGIFDFGGGTTDFDFGIYREANGPKERRYDYVIEHFGAGGDRYLGGENLLELLSFEIFKKNKNKLLASSIQFMKYPEKDSFPGSEILLSHSSEAKQNTKNLMEVLRPLWEEDQDSLYMYDDGYLSVNLTNKEGKQVVNFELDIDKDELLAILRERIREGVTNFFEALRKSFLNDEIELKDIEKINIFLAGNSSKSSILKEVFNEKLIEMKNELCLNLNVDREIFELFEPLNSNNENIEKPTGKTGVAFGLIEARKGGDIKVINHNLTASNEVNFKYYLGESRKRKFKVIVDKNESFNKWICFVDASIDEFEIFYSSSPKVSNNQIAINDDAIRKMIIKLDVIDDNALVYIRLVSPTTVEYVVAYEDRIQQNDYLSEVKKINFSN